ncbi:MAG: 5-oxoprolinase subunit PxpA [Proteobacteria bacterium]|nr:5-oxoprolinase subunit PxpA [Pseudomonadota bacterium]
MATFVDLNSDMGESFGVYTLGHDADMLAIVSSANVACGFHAGDPLIMSETVTRARENRVDVGAHPSLHDLWGFGRRTIQGEPPEDIEKAVVYQIGALQAIAIHAGHRVTHVKTHGALGNMASADAALARAVARGVKLVDRDLIFVAIAGTELERAGAALDLRVAREVYADRTYQDNGLLTPRKQPGAVLHDAEPAARRVLQMVEEQAIRSVNGVKIPVKIDTICVHGDNPAAVGMARAVRDTLERAGITIRPMSQSIN